MRYILGIYENLILKIIYMFLGLRFIFKLLIVLLDIRHMNGL